MFMFPVTLLSEKGAVALSGFLWGGQGAGPQELCGEHGVVLDQTSGVLTNQNQSYVGWMMGPYIMRGVNCDESVLLGFAFEQYSLSWLAKKGKVPDH